MHIVIRYCQAWNYKPKAAGLAAAIHEVVGVTAELVPGKPSQFDVEVDGKLIFSKAKASRFPEPFEITEQLK